MISTESSNKKSLVLRRVEMFGELAKDNTINRSRHLSESNIQNAQSDKLIKHSSSTHQKSSTAANKISANNKSSAMLSLPPQINSPLTTLL